MHLFDPAQHEPCTATGWDAGRAREVADRIASDCHSAWEQNGLRPPGSQTDADADRDYSFWTGAAGVLWALTRLGQGIGEGDLLAGYRSLPDAGTSPGL